jgi:TldD protein
MTIYYRKPEFPQVPPESLTQKIELSEKIHSTVAYLMSAARYAGADFVEFFFETRKHRSFLSEKGIITSVSPSFSSGAGVRVFYKNQDSFVSTTDLSFEGLCWAVEKAVGIFCFSSDGNG